MTAGYSTALRNARLDEITAAIGANGLLRVFSGTRPATGGPETTMLAELALSATAAPAAAGGVLTFNAIADDPSAEVSGTPTWARIVTSGGNPVVDMSAGVGTGDLSFNNPIVAGGLVEVTSLTITDGSA